MVRLGTRGSKLALAQAQVVAQELRIHHPTEEVEIVVIKTKGDQITHLPFGAIGQKGIFVKELDEALLARRVDLAVHSLKDLPSELSEGVTLCSVTACEDPRDAFLSRDGRKLAALPVGAVVGTSSMRRTALLRGMRPDLDVQLLRGNLDTRIAKLEAGKYDAIVVAAAGLKRLGLAGRVTEYLDPWEFVPAVGQGALAVVIRRGDERIGSLLKGMDDPGMHALFDAQRDFMARMEGGCSVPLGCYGEVRDSELSLVAVLSTTDGSRSVKKEVRGTFKQASTLCAKLAEQILENGGREILRGLRLEKGS